MTQVVGYPTPHENFIDCLTAKSMVIMMLGFTLEGQRWRNDMLKFVIILLSIFSNVIPVISTPTKIIEVTTTKRQTQQDVLAGQAAIKQNPLVKQNQWHMFDFIHDSGGRVKSFTWLKFVSTCRVTLSCKEGGPTNRGKRRPLHINTCGRVQIILV